MNQQDISIVKQYLEMAISNVQSAKKILNSAVPESQNSSASQEGLTGVSAELQEPQVTAEGKIIEGVFDGQNMVGPDGKQYSVPANYASKSKLVQGDTLKLTITPDGSFRYKQIKPIERERIIGVLSQEEDTDKYFVLANNHSYKILLASVTYFKGEPGDEVIILKPKNIETEWAAVENIIKNVGAAPLQTMIQQAEILPEIEEPKEKQNFLEQPTTSDALQDESPKPESEESKQDQDIKPEESSAPATQGSQANNSLEEI